jgi:hypothetical protein
LTTFFSEGDFGKRRAVSVNDRRGLTDFSKIAFLARPKKTIFTMAHTPSFSAKRDGKEADLGRSRKKGFASAGMSLGREFVENKEILKISGRLGVVRSSWGKVQTGKMRLPEKRKIFYLQENRRCPISILGKV